MNIPQKSSNTTKKFRAYNETPKDADRDATSVTRLQSQVNAEIM